MSKADRLRVGGQRAKNLFATDAQRDAQFFKERERVRLANAEKTDRLRALRMEKEAAERAAAAEAAKIKEEADRVKAAAREARLKKTAS